MVGTTISNLSFSGKHCGILVVSQNKQINKSHLQRIIEEVGCLGYFHYEFKLDYEVKIALGVPVDDLGSFTQQLQQPCYLTEAL